MTHALAALLALFCAPLHAHELAAEFSEARAIVDRARDDRPLFKAPRARSGACPTDDALARPWVEHTGPLPRAAFEAHLGADSNGATTLLLPVNTVSWWVGASRRGRDDAAASASHGCFVLGSAALYANGPEDAPAVDILKAVESGNEASLGERLIELRWYDPKSGRKHRWFDEALAARLGWSTDGRGRPTETPRPIPMPDAVNELF